MSRDNWERLVAAVLRREMLWQMFHADSISSTSSSDFSYSDLSHQNSIDVVSCHQLVMSEEIEDVAIGLMKNLSRPSRDIQPQEHFRRFSLRELKVATDNFRIENYFPDVFCEVYIGKLEDGREVVVKQEKERLAVQGKRYRRELEIMKLAAHPNVIRLLGFGMTRKISLFGFGMTREKTLLVYPRMVNGSVSSWVRGQRNSNSLLDWALRKKIALGSARGLAYLHETCNPKIIHCDFHAGNVFLNEEFEAIVCQFNLAKIVDKVGSNEDRGVRGTFGFLAPEYITTGICSEKTDVFGYGIFLLELIGGPITRFEFRALTNLSLLKWVKELVKDNQLRTFVDKSLKRNCVDAEVERMVQLALICTQDIPSRRPTMSEVARMLETGDGLSERWEEFYREEIIHKES